MRRSLTKLGTRGLDGRSRVAGAVRRWKDDSRQDLGGDLTRAQESLLEVAARTWLILATVDEWIARQQAIIVKRSLIPVIMQRQQLADSLARHLERLNLERKAQPVTELTTYLQQRADEDE